MSTKYFNLSQCIYSGTAVRKNISNKPGVDQNENPKLSPDFIINNIHNLMAYCVNPIKDKFPKLTITSVYRSNNLNKNIKGASLTSQHRFGYAADIVDLGGEKTSTIFNWIVNNIPEFDQVIWEDPGLGPFRGWGKASSWIHISYRAGNNRNKKTLFTKKLRKLHEKYGNTPSPAGYSHGISKANEEWLEEFPGYTQIHTKK